MRIFLMESNRNKSKTTDLTQHFTHSRTEGGTDGSKIVGRISLRYAQVQIKSSNTVKRLLKSKIADILFYGLEDLEMEESVYNDNNGLVFICRFDLASLGSSLSMVAFTTQNLITFGKRFSFIGGILMTVKHF